MINNPIVYKNLTPQKILSCIAILLSIPLKSKAEQDWHFYIPRGYSISLHKNILPLIYKAHILNQNAVLVFNISYSLMNISLKLLVQIYFGVIPCQVMQVWTWPISEFDKNLPSCYNIKDKIILKISA